MDADFSDSTKLVRSNQILSSDIGDQHVMMSIEEGTYFSLKGPSGRVWELLSETRSLGDIQKALLEEYDVEESQCKKELIALLADMYNSNLIEIRE